MNIVTAKDIIVYRVNDFRYVRQTDILSEEDRNLILKDVLFELQNHPREGVPPVQTFPTLLNKYGELPHWKKLADKAHSLVEVYYNKPVECLEIVAWANMSNETNQYDFHRHDWEGTAVFYLQSDLPEYGTDIDNQFIIKATQNSMVIFDGKKLHSVTNMPPDLAREHNRISIAIDFIIEPDK